MSSYWVNVFTFSPSETLNSSKDNESIFIEDPLYNLIANPDIDNQVKLETARQLKKLAEKLEGMIQEKIEEEQMDDEELWTDENP